MGILNNSSFPTALITGAAQRIGAEIAQFLHAHNFNIVVHYNTSEIQAAILVEKLNNARKNSAKCIQGNLLETENLSKIVNESLTLNNRLDLLVNNASVFIKSENTHSNQNTIDPIADKELFDKIFSINVYAPLALSKLAFTYIQQNNGSIINITDIHGSKPLKEYAVYSQSKAALHMQTKSLAQLFAPNVRVNAVAPGAIIWPENENELDEQIKLKIINQTLLKKPGKPINIAKAVYMLSQNDYISGQILAIDGGRYL